MTPRLYARAAGPLLALLGVAGFFAGGSPLFGALNSDPFESTLHLVTGLVLLLAGFAPLRGRPVAALVLAVSSAHATVGVVGLVLPDLLGLTPGGLSLADDVIHLSVAVLGVAAVDLARRDATARRAEDDGRRATGMAAAAGLLGGPVLALLTGGAGFGVLIFCAGLVLLGIYTLIGPGDRAIGWVMVFIGVLAMAADLTRLLLGIGTG